ncbi:DUF4148 domain-containing protein [Caballeronia grimmiae]|uniref:DUF4148 domain-containing protein n=1 Tax=Caballeronia grimmiae TaxID=1071679 RepID=UPI0038BA5C72
MKRLGQVTCVVTLCVPIIATAQSNASLSREQVRAELTELERAGYRVGDDDPHYPDAIQAAQTRLAARHATGGGYGGAENKAAASGASVKDGGRASEQQLYFGH